MPAAGSAHQWVVWGAIFSVAAEVASAQVYVRRSRVLTRGAWADVGASAMSRSKYSRALSGGRAAASRLSSRTNVDPLMIAQREPYDAVISTDILRFPARVLAVYVEGLFMDSL